MGRRRVRPVGDEGVTLIEVLMALALLATVMAALGPFFVNSFLTVSQQRSQQEAVELGDSAMEQVHALKGSSLLTGRGLTKTSAQWTAAGPALDPYKTTMVMASDPMLDASSTEGDDAPLSTAAQAMTVGSLTYLRSIYVGECDIYISLSGDCVQPDTTALGSGTAKDLQFFRVVVVVTWPFKTCPAGTCTYVTSGLVARAAEPVFDFHRPSPVVNDATVVLYKGVASSYQLDASGGQLPNTWTIDKWPPGLLPSPGGVVSGTPTTVGTTVSTVTVTDTLGRSDTGTVTFKVVLPPTLTVPAAQVGHVGDVVSLQAVAANGVAPYTYAQTGLPAGLSIDKNSGAITGTLTTAGTYTVKITATDAGGGTATGTYTHAVYGPLQLASIGTQEINFGSALTVSAAATGGDGNYRYTASGLPTGVIIGAATGAVSGLPTVPGRYLPAVTVTDGTGGTATTTFLLLVDATNGLAFTTPDQSAPDQTSAVGTAMSVSLGTNGSVLGLKPKEKYTASGLPAGLSFNSGQGTISGTPTQAGTYVVTLTASILTQSTNLTFVWTVK